MIKCKAQLKPATNTPGSFLYNFNSNAQIISLESYYGGDENLISEPDLVLKLQES